MRSVRITAVALLALLAASPSFAAVSKELADFPKGPADLLMTKEEKKQWKTLTTDDEAKAFTELFWARRDPTPGTKQNELRRDFDERVEVANARFHSSYGPGAGSDRGKVFILMGSPTRIRRSAAAPTSTIQSSMGRSRVRDAGVPTPGGAQPDSPKEVWEYEQGKSYVQLGQPLVQVAFIDQYATGDWKMERAQSDTATVFERVAKEFIRQPDLQSVPVFPEPAAAGAAPPMTDVKTGALRAALDTARAAAPSDKLFITYGEFVTPAGEHFVPVQLYVPSTAAFPAGAPVVFFGRVEKESGETVAAFEEPATMTPATEGAFYSRSLQLAAGKYRGSFGLALGDKPIAATSVPLEIAGLEKDAPGVSALILTNKIYPLAEAQNPTDPFAFGGLKVVPKSDGVFHRSEELSYFFEIRNPAIDPTTNQPNLTMKVSIAGTTGDGKPVKMAGAPEPATPRALNGVPGHYVIGEALPLTTFAPGSYTLTIKLMDLVLKQSYERSGTFRIIE